MEFKQFRDTYLMVAEDGTIMNMITGVIQKPKYNNFGYGRVCVGHKDQYVLSRVVAECFLPNPDNLPQVDHIDRNPSNNHVSNLRWVSAADNLKNRNDYKNSPFGVKYINPNKPGRSKKFRVRLPNQKAHYFYTLEEAKAFLAEQTLP
jgi:hypothetical protein